MSTETVRPDANKTIGGSIQLFPDGGEAAWQDVDEVTSDDDTTYIFAANSGLNYHLAHFGAANPSASAGVINSVTVHVMVRSVSGGFVNGRIACGTVAGTYSAPLIGTYSSTSYTEKTREFTTDPNTGVAWTWAAITDLMIGVQLQAFGGGLENRCTQVWAVIDFDIPGELAGLYKVVQERFHYVDASGIERYLQGVAV